MLSSGFSLSPLITPSTDTVDLASTSGEHEGGVAHRLPGITLISEWPHGSFLENLAVKHDGHLLVTVYSSNEIYRIDPHASNSNRILLNTLPAGPTGIVELAFNHFYVNAGTIGQRNTWSIYGANLHQDSLLNTSFNHIVDINPALYLNGLCVLSYANETLLSVDSMLGQIFKISIQTKKVEVWYENDLLKRRSHDVHVPGVNGIRRCSIDGSIYLTNTDRAIILRLRVDPFDYRPKGQLETIVRNIVCDDFTIDRMGNIYATTHAHNSLMRLTLVKDGEYLREEIATIADGLAGATACAFGRTYDDRTSLYITTTGGQIQSHQREPQIVTNLLSGNSNNPTASSTAKLLKLNVGATSGLHEPPKRVLVVCSSHPRGLYLSEFAEPYNILRKKFDGKEGIEFVLVSPKGGSIPIDSTSYPQTEVHREEWSSAIRLISQSSHPLLDNQHAADYDAVYLPGGHAPMFDLVDHRYLKQLLLDFDTQMKPIAAICHGVVGLVNVRRIKDSNALIHGRIITGFSSEEELTSANDNDANLVTTTPFILETKLKSEGAIYTKAAPGKENIVQDGLLLTGQNPASARQLAYRFGDLITQCAAHDYQQVNLTSSLPKTLITCHVALTNNNPQLLSRLKLAHLEYIQRYQHLIIFSGSALFVESSNVTQQDSSTMIILLATGDLRLAQQFIEHEPYTASKQIFDVAQIKPFKQLFPSANNQQILNHHIQQELFKSHHPHQQHHSQQHHHSHRH